MRAGRRLLLLIVLAGAAAVTTAIALGAVWGSAIEVPGTATLNVSGALVSTVSCAKAGFCAAGGEYVDASDHEQAFVVDEQSGTWGTAIEVPGSEDLNVDGDARLLAISCPGPGSCAAAGFYRDGNGDGHGFLVNESNGVWGSAMKAPGVPAYDGGFSEVSSISCTKVGFCTAGGSFDDYHSYSHAFVVTETNGVWHKAVKFGRNTELDALACATAVSCAAGGGYDGGCPCQGFVVNETKGTWGKVEVVPGLVARNNGPDAVSAVNSISCPAAGSCTVGGYYTGGHDLEYAFVADQKHGVWGKAIKVKGAGTFGPGEVYSISCGAPGSCAAGGYYDSSHHSHPFVVSEGRGIWREATTVQNLGSVGEVDSVFCLKTGFCTAGGDYIDGSGAGQAFVVNGRNGVWHDAIEVPGTAALNLGRDGQVWSIFCVTGGSCTAGGSYRDAGGILQAFVTSP